MALCGRLQSYTRRPGPRCLVVMRTTIGSAESVKLQALCPGSTMRVCLRTLVKSRARRMKLLSLKALRYRSLRNESIPLSDLNLFIGSNASGKSTILDALRFLHEGVQERDFKPPVFSRGGIVHLAWKGEEAHRLNSWHVWRTMARLSNGLSGLPRKRTSSRFTRRFPSSVKPRYHLNYLRQIKAEAGGGPAQRGIASCWHSRRQPVHWLPPQWMNHFRREASQSS